MQIVMKKRIKNKMNNNEYKEKEYHTAVRTVPKSNQKIVETNINSPDTHRTIDSL